MLLKKFAQLLVFAVKAHIGNPVGVKIGEKLPQKLGGQI
jgi:hypothetical protein